MCEKRSANVIDRDRSEMSERVGHDCVMDVVNQVHLTDTTTVFAINTAIQSVSERI